MSAAVASLIRPSGSIAAFQEFMRITGPAFVQSPEALMRAVAAGGWACAYCETHNDSRRVRCSCCAADRKSDEYRRKLAEYDDE